MQEVKVGQVWAVYSRIRREWTPATVTRLLNGCATMEYHVFPERLSCATSILLTEPGLYRLVSDVSD